MIKLLNDGKPCELDNPAVSIAAWYLRRTRGRDDDEYGITTVDVSDERVEELLVYFSGGRNGERSNDLQ